MLGGLPVRACEVCGCEVVADTEAREYVAGACKVQEVRERAAVVAAALGCSELGQIAWESDTWRRIVPALVAGVLVAVSEREHSLAERGL